MFISSLGPESPRFDGGARGQGGSAGTQSYREETQLKGLATRIAKRLPRAIANRGLPRIYFLHIPKTGGLSVTLWLKRQIGESHSCAAITWDELIRIDPSALRRYRLFCGHFGVDLKRFLRGSLRTVTVLRDPVERTISHYHHVHRDIYHPCHRRVARESLDEFVQNPDNWPMIDNFQARYLVGTPVDITHASARFDWSDSKRGRLSVLSEDARFLLDPGYVRERSREVIERDITVIGTTEQLPEFLSRVAREFSLPLPLPEDVPRINVAPVSVRDVQAESKTRDIIRELTAIDQELWNSCRHRSHTEPISRLAAAD